MLDLKKRMHFGEVHSLQSKKFSIVFENLLGTGEGC
jgi:hypothetical protein